MSILTRIALLAAYAVVANAQCKLPATVPVGFVTNPGCNAPSTGTTTLTPAQCKPTCATGYLGTPTATCTANVFTLAGCTKYPAAATTTNACKLPATMPTSVVETGCAAAKTTLTPASSCVLSCVAGSWTGSVNPPKAVCATNGGTFTVSGTCSTNSNTCKLPATATAGYVTTSCSSATTVATTGSKCPITCADGYTATNPRVHCATAGGTFTFSGCSKALKASSDPSGSGPKSSGDSSGSWAGTYTAPSSGSSDIGPMYYWQWVTVGILICYCCCCCCGGGLGGAYYYQQNRMKRNRAWGGAGAYGQPMAGGAGGAYDYSPYSQGGMGGMYSPATGGNMGYGPSYY